ncbi:Trk system potassium transporter TrkA [Thermodesulfobacteriota bacterium]
MFGKKNNKSENILILGLGGVGLYLAKRLFHEGYSITVIESDIDLVNEAVEQIDALLIKGDAMDVDCWRTANAKNMDFLIAVTDNDAVNIVSSMIADRFGIQRKIARIRSLDFGNGNSILNTQDLKIDLIIHPEELAAQEIVRLIKRTAGNEIIDIAQGQLQVMATRIHEKSPLANRKLKDISRMHEGLPFRVVAIARGINTIIPGGGDKLLPQDQVLIMASTKHISLLLEVTGEKQRQRHNVMILGGGLVGSRVAELLGKTVEAKLVEKDYKRAEELSYRLENTEILHGDGGDENILGMAGLADMDTFVTATEESQFNILSCLLAKNLMNKQGRYNMGKTIAMVDQEDYLVLASTIGLDIALSKKILAGNEILKFIRRGELISVAHIHGFDTEVVELVAEPKSPITRAPLSKQDLSSNGRILIGAVFRNETWETALGDTHIIEGERVIAVCTSPHLKTVRELFLV